MVTGSSLKQLCRWASRLLNVHPLAPAPLFSEYVPEAQIVGQVKQCHHVPNAGPHPLIPPAPYRVWVRSETAVQLRPRQVRLPLEPHEPLREVVVSVVSRERVSSPTAAIRLNSRPHTGEGVKRQELWTTSQAARYRHRVHPDGARREERRGQARLVHGVGTDFIRDQERSLGHPDDQCAGRHGDREAAAWWA